MFLVQFDLAFNKGREVLYNMLQVNRCIEAVVFCLQ